MPLWEEIRKNLVNVMQYPVLSQFSSRTKRIVRVFTCAVLCVTAVSIYHWKVKSYDPSLVKDVQPKLWNVKNNLGDFSRMNYQESIEYVQTPVQAQKYCDWLCSRPTGVFDEGKYMSGFKKTHEGRSPVDCSEVAYAAAALLSDNEYPPLIIAFTPFRFLKSKGHALFVYKEQGNFGSVGIEPGDFQHPVHESLESLVCYITKSHADPAHPRDMYRYYSLFNLNENDPDYITTERDLFRLFLRDSLTVIPEK